MKLISADHLLKNMRAKMKPSTYAAMKMFVDAEEDLNKPVTAVRTFRIWYVWKCGYCDGDLNDLDYEYCPWCGRPIAWPEEVYGDQ